MRRVLTVVAVVSLLLVQLPAQALVSEACPSHVPSGGFNDLGGLSADAGDAVDCLAHYDVVRGTSANAFTPNLTVARWQMALFLTRTLTALERGLPGGASQGFTDIAGFDSATQTAINQVRELGITTGTTPTTFSPTSSVSRWQMALFLTRLLTAMGKTLPSGSSQGFTDIGNLPGATQTAINQIRQLGISTGTTSTTFSPNQLVSRWQMALFLARTLEVGLATAYRVTVSLSASSAPTSDTVVATATVRNPDGSLASGKRVDLFVAGSIDGAGRCVLDSDAHIGGGDAGTGSNCVLDNGDPLTNSQGVATINLTHANVNEVDQVFAWVGEVGETFDSQDVRGEGSAPLTWGPPPTGLALPDQLAFTFGTQASVKAQLTGSGGAAVAAQNQSIRFVVLRGSTVVLQQSINTGSAGSATLTYTGPADPSGSDDAAIVDTVTAFWDRDRDNSDDGVTEFDDTGTVIWDEALPPVSTAALSQSEVSTLVGTFTPISITVRDRNNQPVPGATVTFQSTSGQSSVATTNGAGVAGFSYTVTTDGLADSIDAKVDLNGDGDVIDAGDLGFGGVADLVHYWVEAAPAIGGTIQFDLIARNGGANTIDVVQVGTSNYWRLTYDSSDAFNVGGGGIESSRSIRVRTRSAVSTRPRWWRWDPARHRPLHPRWFEHLPLDPLAQPVGQGS